ATSGIDNIYIHQVEGDVSLNSISAAGHIAFITSNLGAILNGRTDNNAIVRAGKADLIANTNIGTATKRIVSTVANIEGIATTGSIYLWNIGGLTVGGVVDGSDPALKALHGTVDVRTSSPVTIAEDIIGASIVKQAGDVPAADDDLTVKAGVHLTATGL